MPGYGGGGITPADVESAADTLRAWALDGDLERRVMATSTSAVTAATAARVAGRYTAGGTIGEAIEAAQAGMQRGHLPSIDYVGESARDGDLARAQTDVFLKLVGAVEAAGLASTISFDLSHVGSLIDPALGLEHARWMARAGAVLGTALMISAEGSERTDLVLDQVLHLPGTVRLVEGAFLEPGTRPTAVVARS